MKYMVSSRHQSDVLKATEQIKVDYRDKDFFYDHIEMYPDKEWYLYIPTDTMVDWVEVEALSKQCDLTIILEDFVHNYKACRGRQLKYMWAYPVTNYAEFTSILVTGVSELILGEPLCFNLPPIKVVCERIGVQLRMVPNRCYENYIPRKTGVNGIYIRPEDVPVYEQYIDSLSFAAKDLSHERVLFRVYHNEKKWPGNLNLLLTNLQYDFDSRALPDEFADIRTKCRQKCMEPNFNRHTCQYCLSAFNLAKALAQGENRRYLESLLDRESKHATRDTKDIDTIRTELNDFVNFDENEYLQKFKDAVYESLTKENPIPEAQSLLDHIDQLIKETN